jgi:hypothetical protein
MDITVHHTIELGEHAMLVALLGLAAAVFCAIYYPMVVPVSSPEPPKGKLGFRPNQCD